MRSGHYDQEAYIALISENPKVVVIPSEPANIVDNTEKGEQRSMALYFKNSYSTDVNIAIAYRLPQCTAADRSGFVKVGWMYLQPNQTGKAHSGNVGAINPLWLCFAIATDGRVWDGTQSTTVSGNQFAECFNYPLTYRVGFRWFDVNSYQDFTVELV